MRTPPRGVCIVALACLTAIPAHAFSVPPTTPPSVNAGPDRVVNVVSLQNATVANAVLTTWTQQSGPLGGLIVFGTPLAEDTTVSANLEGVYVLRLTAVNLLGTAFDETTFIWDTTAPVLGALPDLTVDAAAGGSAVVLFPNPAISDATPTTLTFSHPSGSSFPMGVTQVNITATDSAGNSSSTSFKITVVDSASPVVLSPPTATPNPALANSPVAFSCAAADATPLTWSWNFGDGTASTEGAATSHTYTAAGVYNVVVTVTDAVGLSATGGLTLTVGQPGGDGPSTGGTGGTGGGSAGTGGISGIIGLPPGTPVLPMSVLKLSGSCRFDKSDADCYNVTGAITLPQDATTAGVNVAVSLGGATMTFVLDEKGRARQSGSSFALKASKSGDGVATFQARLKGSFQAAWTDESLTPASTVESTSFTVELAVGRVLYGATSPVSCRITPNKSAKFKR